MNAEEFREHIREITEDQLGRPLHSKELGPVLDALESQGAAAAASVYAELNPDLDRNGRDDLLADLMEND